MDFQEISIQIFVNLYITRELDNKKSNDSDVHSVKMLKTTWKKRNQTIFVECVGAWSL
jgi:hypothetical protein